MSRDVPRASSRLECQEVLHSEPDRRFTLRNNCACNLLPPADQAEQTAATARSKLRNATMKKLFRIVTFGAIALCLRLPAQAALFTFAADLTGEAEVPPVLITSAFGTTIVVYDDALHTLTISIDFIGLVDTTTAAHIHAPASPGVNAGVAVTPITLPGFPLGVTSANYEGVVDLTLPGSYTDAFRTNFGGGTTAGSEAAIFSFLQSGQAYVNVHTTSFPAGEIRGYLVQVPNAAVPDTATTMFLFSFALGVMGLVARRPRLAA